MTRGTRLLAGLVALLALVGCGGAGKKDPMAGPSDRELYDLGMKSMEKEKYYQARRYLERIVNRGNQDPDLAAEVQLAIADSYYGKKGVLNLADAMSRYASFVTYHPTHEKADYAQYRLALCHLHQVYAPDRDQRETHTALEEFQKVLVNYPDSPYVDLAGEKINECYELLAEHHFRVGMFYYQRKAYLGAIDRFLSILDEYPRYSERDQVYYYLSDALIRTSRLEEADVYLAKLLETYPDSEFVKKSEPLRQQLAQAR